MKVGSLFAGYDGIGLGLDLVWPGQVERAWFVEFDPAPSKILAHHWSDVPNYGDITTVDWSTVEPVDILTGGFPCQDLSHAGKRLGLRPGTRSGLWEHFAYAIASLRPRLVVIENVRGILSASAHCDLERDCWCVGDEREPALRALGAVLGDLAGLGYDARWGGVRAADAGAPHGRFRVFIVAVPAHPDIAGLEGRPAVRRGAGERPAGAGGVGAGPGVTLLPTPTSQAAKHGGTPDVNANGYGSNLWDLPHLLEGITDGDSTQARPDQALSDVRGADDPQKVRAEPDPRGHGPVPVAEDMRPGLWQHEDGGGPGGAPMEGAAASGQRVPGVRHDRAPACSPHRPDAVEQRPGEPDDAVRVVSPEAALAGGPSAADGGRAPGTGDISGTWGPYAPAVLRWEMVTQRVAPSPTEAGKDGRPRLSPRAVEWLMGLPAGHVTDPAIGLTRAQQLKALGNGVVPQQAALALRLLLGLGGAPVPRGGELLNTPTSADAKRTAPSQNARENYGATTLGEQVALLPTPEAKLSDSGPDYARANRAGSGGDDLTTTVHRMLLPTPNPFHAGNEEDPDEWRKRRADVFKRTGTRHGPALGVVAKSLLPGQVPLTVDTYMPEED